MTRIQPLRQAAQPGGRAPTYASAGMWTSTVEMRLPRKIVGRSEPLCKRLGSALEAAPAPAAWAETSAAVPWVAAACNGRLRHARALRAAERAAGCTAVQGGLQQRRPRPRPRSHATQCREAETKSFRALCAATGRHKYSHSKTDARNKGADRGGAALYPPCACSRAAFRRMRVGRVPTVGHTAHAAIAQPVSNVCQLSPSAIRCPGFHALARRAAHSAFLL